MYADVILPVPLDGMFTYAVPPSLEHRVKTGQRVLVPFGRNKNYVGIIGRLHDEKPEGYQVKPIALLLDDTPVLLPEQLKLWQWISDYYMSPIGEVYKAAMPAGLKAEEGYKPRTETFIRLTPNYQNEPTLHVALNILARAPKQQEAFIAYLSLSRWDTIEGNTCSETVLEITREELINAAETTLPVINQLVKRGFLETYEVEVGRLNQGGEPHPEHIKPLSAAQQEAYDQILRGWTLPSPSSPLPPPSTLVPPPSFLPPRPSSPRVTLLHGVTSSGKTEIYIHLIQRELDEHRQVLFLMPEIALTVQMMQRLQRVFGRRLGIYHSKYSDAERVEIWQKQLSDNPYDVILGARSAVFLPFQRLGLVIVDEEHETSYKQQDPMPRYHARSAAIMLASFLSPPSAPKGAIIETASQTIEAPSGAVGGAVVLLGTATPSLESYHNAKTGKYGLVELNERYQGIELPEIQVVDTRDLQHRKMMHGPFSPQLLASVREALQRGEQAILFQNRRGWAPMIECRQCGWVPRCQHCDVSLTLHRTMNQLSCHYCGYTYRVPEQCPACGSKSLQGRGYGTEKIEDQIRDIFPEARVARMDLDTTRTRNAYERIITDFSAGRTNLLIGTQMISKGLDFDKVSVVGILDADAMLNQPDFRAYEHAFMMMAQVSGRAGRKGRRGLVILQTKSPDLPVVRQVVNNDYATFAREHLQERRAFHYPPYYRLIYVYLKHSKDVVVNTAAIEMGTRLRQWFGDRVLGPDKPAVARVKTLSIRKLVLKLETGIDMPLVRKYLAFAQQQILQDKRYASLQIYYDVDPL